MTDETRVTLRVTPAKLFKGTTQYLEGFVQFTFGLITFVFQTKGASDLA